MDSEPERDQSGRLESRAWVKNGPPWLRLYEEEEYNHRAAQSAIVRNDASGSVDHEKLEGIWTAPTGYTHMRFFDSVAGYHKGYLDLTGRHKERYETLLRRVTQLLCEVTSLLTHAKKYEYTEKYDFTEWGGYEYILDDDGSLLWDGFRRKWNLTESWNFTTTANWTTTLSKTLEQFPQPKFQELCLSDLPVELMDNIYQHTSIEEARSFSSTCRLLREIGLRYIFGSRELELKDDLDWARLRKDPDGDHSQYLLQRALRARSVFIESADFFLSRPDLHKSVERLTLKDGWSSASLEGTWAKDFVVLDHEPDYYAPVVERFVATIRASISVISLWIHRINLSSDVLGAFAEMQNLETLQLIQCSVPLDVQLLIRNRSIPLSPAVLNLILFLDTHEETEYSSWYVLSLLPQVRNLSVTGHSSDIYVAPIDSLQEICNPFATLERLSLRRFTHYQVETLAVWMVRASGPNSSEPPQLKLTHLSIHCRWAIVQQQLRILVAVLRFAPHLEVLALDGLDGTPPGLIRGIANAVPDLLGLTLVRRANGRQHEAKLTNWPAPSWEYAEQLARFTRLRYFAWNWTLDSLESTPASMLDFESNFRDSGEDVFFDKDSWFFLDAHLAAAPFAARCPTLREFAIVDTYPHLACRIWHNDEGYPHIEDLGWDGLLRFSLPWCPSDLSAYTWPKITRRELDARALTSLS